MADEKNRSCDSRLCIRPFLEKETVVKLAKELFGLEVDVGATIKELESYDDRNFLMQGRIIPGPKTENCERRGLSNNNGNYERKSQQFVFKVMNSRDSYRYGFVDAIDGAMRHLHVHLGINYDQICLRTGFISLFALVAWQNSLLQTLNYFSHDS